MTKVVIDDAMVERAIKAMWKKRPDCHRWETATPEYSTRLMLEAALSTPEEPEIAVTDEMRKAGWKVFTEERCFWHLSEDDLVRFYRAFQAMESIRRKEQGVCGRAPYGAEEEFQPIGIIRTHRRQGDPK